MPLSANGRNRGAYSSPFSGVGQEFCPLGIAPDLSGVVLHETGYLERNAAWNFPNVFSPFWRLYYDFAPGHQMVFEHKTVRLGPGRLVLTPSYVRFHAQGDQPVPSFWLHFSCARHAAPSQPVPVRLVPTPTERRLIAEVVWFFKREKLAARAQISSFSLALLEVVLSRPELAWAARTPAGITRAIHHIEAQFASECYNRHLAELAHLSVRSFTRAFRRHQGVSPAQFIARVRVRKAAHLLLTTDAGIEEIAEKTGFPDRAYFTRVFTRLARESPAAFRQKHRMHLGECAV